MPRYRESRATPRRGPERRPRLRRRRWCGGTFRRSRSPTLRGCSARSIPATRRWFRSSAAPRPAARTRAAGPEPAPVSFHRIRRVQIPGQKQIDFAPRVLRQLGIQTVEVVPAGRVVIDLVFEFLALGLQRLNEVLDLEVIDILIVRGGVDEQRRLQ